MIEVEIKKQPVETEFRIGDFSPYTAAFIDNRFCFIISTEEERKAAIRVCEYIANELRKGV